MTVIDVSEADFEREVIERSAELPVVVDFWAEWCGPCRALGPLLEQAAGEREGKVVLAKLDTDANPNLAQVFQIRGIPAVKAFSDRRLVDEFVGAQDREAVGRFFDELLPSQADLLVESGEEDDLRRALALEPSRPDAALALARMLIARGDEAGGARSPRAGRRQLPGRRPRRPAAPAERKVELSDAFAALDRGELEHALEQLLAALPAAEGRRDDIRRVIVGELDALGPEHPLARDTRSRLASALY